MVKLTPLPVSRYLVRCCLSQTIFRNIHTTFSRVIRFSAFFAPPRSSAKKGLANATDTGRQAKKTAAAKISLGWTDGGIEIICTLALTLNSPPLSSLRFDAIRAETEGEGGRRGNHHWLILVLRIRPIQPDSVARIFKETANGSGVVEAGCKNPSLAIAANNPAC